MKMASLWASLLIPFAFVSIPIAMPLSAYQVLQNYGLPIGLLPKGVIGYELNPITGEFSAHLGRTCKFSVKSYNIEYRADISGVISQGKVEKLEGVKVRVAFLWVGIKEVIREWDQLKFSVGIASAKFPIYDFDEGPDC